MHTVSQAGLGARSRATFGEVWRALTPWRIDYAFVLRVDKIGAVHVDRGSLRPQLLAALCTVLAELDLKSGWIAGVWDGVRLNLILCDRWPVDVRQRVRDAWARCA